MEEKTFEKFKEMNAFQIFISYFKSHRKLFILDMICAFLIAVIDLAFPFISRWCMYTLLPDNAWKTFWIVMGVVFCAYILRSLFNYVITYWGHTFGILVEADIRQDLFKHMQTFEYDFYNHNRTGELMSRLTSDLFDITELAHHGPEDLFISLTTITGSLIIMFSIQWKLALVIALIIPVFILVVWNRKNAIQKASIAVKERTAGINVEIESCLSGMKTAKAFANESMEMDKFNESNEKFKVSKKDCYQQMAIFSGVMEFFMCVLSLAVIAVGGGLIMNNELNSIDLITFSLYVSTFITPVRKLANFSELFANGTAGLHRFIQLMRRDAVITDTEDAGSIGSVEGEICLDNVSFSYEENTEALKEINLEIKPGETIAFVGPSGGGKTTLSQLITRFYDVSDGSVKIDGTDVRHVTQHSLHKNIGIVQQDVFLFSGSIADNIRYGNLKASMEDVIQAAKDAEIYDDIMEMPDKFDTYVGERGVLLSGGQKQRISIARIFLKNPPVLILDEATSALDSVTEAKIQKTFDRLSEGRTTIIIAHRLSTVRNADRIAVIEHGRITEIGSHEELLKLNGKYASLAALQKVGNNDEN